MKEENNMVIKQECHSQQQPSGMPHKNNSHSKLDLESHPILLRNDEILNQVQDDEGRKNKENIGQVLPDNKVIPLSPCGIGTHDNVPSPWRGKVGEARMRGKSAFTLIELLVVILIIGILAAIAVPQYQKTIEKSKAVQGLALLNSLGEAFELYYLTHGAYPNQFAKLDVDMTSWSGTESWIEKGFARDVRSNEDWSLVLVKNSDSQAPIQLGRLSGPYKGAGWVYSTADGRQVRCVERFSNKTVFEKEQGDYCTKLFGKSYSHKIGGLLLFK